VVRITGIAFGSIGSTTVRRGCQEAIDLMRSWHRLRLGAAITVERRPDSQRRRAADGPRSARTTPHPFSQSLLSQLPDKQKFNKICHLTLNQVPDFQFS
jgi:hypothetical protein